MVKLYDTGVFLIDGKTIIEDNENAGRAMTEAKGKTISKEEAAKNTMAYGILSNHNTSGNMDKLKIRFDAMASHDITYVGIIQTARASGLEKFPMPYVLTNCHNSLCAVGGTINEDDHLFGLSCAKKYGGIYVPAHQAVIHQYMREMMSGVGKMILGSDSHTRYGALGTMAMGEGEPELVKQLLNKTYDIDRPQVIAVYLTGKPEDGVRPQDVALAIIGAVFDNGYVKNKVMEFVGDGISGLSVDYRNGIDVMTTETTCLSSVWRTDSKVKEWYDVHGRSADFKEQDPGDIAYYDGLIYIDLSTIKPMIAMPFHPSNIYTIEELNANLLDILDEVEKTGAKQLDNDTIKFSLKDKVKNGKLIVEQGVIAGCAGGTYENICDAADIIKGNSIGNGEFALSVYPSSQPVFLSLVENGKIADIMMSGATVRSAFCGPCFGAGDVPANNCLSIRHSTRNFPNREGSKITSGQIASVALMDARSIAATAINKGVITPATDLDVNYTKPKYFFNGEVYENRCYNGYGKADPSVELRFGPEYYRLARHERPYGRYSSQSRITYYGSRYNYGRAHTFGRNVVIPFKSPQAGRVRPFKKGSRVCWPRERGVQKAEKARLDGKDPVEAFGELKAVNEAIKKEYPDFDIRKTGIGSTIYAVKPGDGSAREQAASCQKVLGGWANIAKEYATKRYRSNLINWGMLPFIFEQEPPFENGDYIFVPGIRKAIDEKKKEIPAYIVKDGKTCAVHA